MNPEVANSPIEVGQTFSPRQLNDHDLMSTLVNFFGLNIEKDLALVVIAAGCFFIGVMVASFLPKEMGFPRHYTVISAPISFLLTTPIWFGMLRGDIWPTNISAIDAFLKFAFQQGEISGQMFAFGVVMLLGALSWPILRMFKGILHFVLSKFPRNPPPPDPAPTPPAP